VNFYGFEIGQITFLALLCGAFLIAVLLHGMLKMRINTMKGMLAERMLRRFRYSLINRILRFPKPYFQRTSQGELVSMVTSESEPMGGMMGDAISQPVLQAGQMLTILSFLFLQSLWFGLAAIALIPIQAWLIPKLQKQVNLLNKERIQEVRQLASEIGESAAGASALRMNRGWRYNMAVITDRLGRLFDIRVRIYQKKFFMKFINNFITQLTPFFFFSIGGFLVIQGKVSLGALVAALAAYKDLSSPWKELLAYYNQVQDMSLRWEIITERFAPAGMVDEALLEGQPLKDIQLAGDLILQDVTVCDTEGTTVLEDLTLTLPKASLVAISAPNEEDRRAMSELLTREIIPFSGNITVAGHDLTKLHQGVIAARIGYASSRPYVFSGTIGENVMMSLRNNPDLSPAPEAQVAQQEEALRSGNSPDPLVADWIDISLAGFETEDELRQFLLKLVEGMDAENTLFNRGLEQTFELGKHPELTKRLVELRPVIAKEIETAGLSSLFYPLIPETYNPAFPIGENLLFAIPNGVITQQKLATHFDFIKLLRDLELEATILELAQDVVEMLYQTFGTDKTDHPLFRRLGLDVQSYEKTVSLVHKNRDASAKSLTQDELAQVMTVPFLISAEHIGPILSDAIKDKILNMVQSKPNVLKNRMTDLFTPLDQKTYAPGLTVLENAIFGKTRGGAAAKANALRETVADTLLDANVKTLVSELIYDLPTGLGGENLPILYAEHMAFCQAAVKRPDILILNKVMASFDEKSRIAMSVELRDILPNTTLIYLEDCFQHPENFDVYIELENGRIKTREVIPPGDDEKHTGADLSKKLLALEKAVLFAGLNRKQLRLLAFSARWFTAAAGEFIFHMGDDPADGAYLILEGEADFYLPTPDGDEKLVRTVGQGSLVGEISLIRNEARTLDMRAQTELKALRIGKDEFLAIVENDAPTAMKLLQVILGYLIDKPN
jgi:ABC-type multidrug transport system fused ATPase/permease subunit